MTSVSVLYWQAIGSKLDHESIRVSQDKSDCVVGFRWRFKTDRSIVRPSSNVPSTLATDGDVHVYYI